MLGVTISPSQSDMQTALRSFMLSVLPTDCDIVAAQDNRVAEPSMANFVVVTPIRFVRLATNYDTFQDSTFFASISGTTLSVVSFSHGEIEIGALLTGPGVPPMTLVTAGPADGGPGDYTINSSIPSVPGNTFHAGAKILQISGQWKVQLDFHSEDYSSTQNAATMSLLFRDLYGTDYFKALPAPQNSITPFFMDEGGQRPFINDQQQYEWRWVAEAIMQVNMRIVVAQEFAQEVKIDPLIIAELVESDTGLAMGTNPP